MEDAMITAVDLFADILKEARTVVGEAAPRALLAEVATLSDPKPAWSDSSHAEKLFEAFESEFGFIRLVVMRKQVPAQQERVQWVGLMRWLLNAFAAWTRKDDPDGRTLTALFVVMLALGSRDLLDALPNEAGDNAEVTGALATIVGGLSFKPKVRSGAAIPIWETEAVAAFQTADANRDWMAIAEGWRMLESAALFSGFQLQSVRWLYRFARDNLIQTVATIAETPVAFLIAHALPSEERLTLAAASNNPFVEFACLYESLNENRLVSQASQAEEQLMKALLVKAASDAPRWQSWMQVFNKYPLRFPSLQIPLGQALAEVSDAACEVYVNSIDLRAKPAGPDASRLCVAECLREFRKTASAARQTMLWTLSFKRWKDWTFDAGNDATHVFDISWCEIDYAVMGYVVECMDAKVRAATVTELNHRIFTLDNSWHASLSDIYSAFNRLVSTLQPYLHADRIAPGSDWLSEKTFYRVFDDTNAYALMIYSVR